MEKLVILSLLLASTLGEDVQLKLEGPDARLFSGDFYKYVCTATGNVGNGTELVWRYVVNDRVEDISKELIAEDERLVGDSMVARKTILKPSVMKGKVGVLFDSLACYAMKEGRELAQIKIDITKKNGYLAVRALDEPSCDENQKITLRRWGSNFKSQYWVGHRVTNEKVELEGSGDLGVKGMKLSCLSKNKVKWIITKKIQNFRYYTGMAGDCHVANLVLSPLSEQNAIKFICGQDEHGSTVQIDYIAPPPTRSGRPDEHVVDFNKTQECIEYLGTTVFGNSALTWATGGTSLMSVAMMIGIVFLKKQLNKQKEEGKQGSNNNNEQSQSQSPNKRPEPDIQLA